MVGECPVVFLYISLWCFKTVLRGPWTFDFVGLEIVFWVLYVELGGLLTPFVTRLSFFTSHLMKTHSLLPHSVSKSPATVSSILPSPSTLGLSTSGYTAIKRITLNFLIKLEYILENKMYNPLGHWDSNMSHPPCGRGVIGLYTPII